MTVRRLLTALVVVAISSLGLVGPAAANHYGPSSGQAQVSKTVIRKGGTVTVRGSGFCRHTAVHVTVSVNGKVYKSKWVLSGRSGRVETRLTLTKVGRNLIKLRGCKRGHGTQVLSATVRVKPRQHHLHAGNAASVTTKKPTDLTSLYAGAGLLLAGSLVVGVARNRRKITA